MSIYGMMVADDHALFRAGLHAILRYRVDRDIRVVEADSFADAVAALQDNTDISVVLCSLDMPEEGPGRNLSSVVKAAGELPVIGVSAHCDADSIHGAFAEGVRGYVPKQSGLDQLLTCIDKVLRGQICRPPGELRAHEEGDAPSAAGSPQHPLARLTRREQSVLSGLLNGLSNKEIARVEGISDATVKLHMRSIFDKLDVTNRTQAALRAIRLMGASATGKGLQGGPSA